MTSNQLWFVRQGGTVLGQFPLKEIAQALSTGEMSTNDEISPDQANWLPLSGFPGLVQEQPLPPETLSEPVSAGVPDEDTQPWRQERVKAAQRWEADPTAHQQPMPHSPPPNPFIRRMGIALVLFAVAGLGILVTWQWQTPPESPKLEIPSPIPSCDAAPAPRVNWRGCDKSGTLLSGSDLAGANLNRAKLNSTDLSGSRLAEANLSQADLSYATLNQADLSHANLVGADLHFAELNGANLSGADLRDANLADVVLAGARLDRATWTDGRTCATGSLGQCL
jgi:hypothetical protein